MKQIITEELSLLERVSTLLSEMPYEVPPSEEQIVADLLYLREQMPHAKEEDRGSLMDQYNARLYLLEQLRATRDRPQVNPESPYLSLIHI